MKLLIIGQGSIGSRYSRLLKQLGQGYAVYDPQLPEDKKEAGVEYLHDLQELSRFRAVFVCSPPESHIPQALQALEAGVPVFLEKPMSPSLEGLDNLVRASQKPGAPLNYVSCNYRFEEGIKIVKSELEKKTLGKLYFVDCEFGFALTSWRPHLDYRKTYSASRAGGGGVVIDRIHEIDYLIYLLGRPQLLSSVNSRVSSLEMDVEDLSETLLRFPNEVMGRIHQDYLQKDYTCKFKIVGEKGTLLWQFKPSSVELITPISHTFLYQDLNPQVDDMYRRQLEYFIGCVDSQKPVFNTFEDAYKTMELGIRAREFKV